jgi:hypothetical protein
MRSAQALTTKKTNTAAAMDQTADRLVAHHMTHDATNAPTPAAATSTSAVRISFST